MKRRVCITMILCAALLLAALPVHGAADWGESVDSVSALLGRGARLTANTYWTGGSYRTEHYIELSPGAAIRPVVASRDALCSVASMAAMAAELEEDTGLHVVAGINGGFYSTTDLVPVGIVIRDGSPRCSDSGYEAIGFRADGSFIAGKPASMLSLWSGETLLNNAMTLNVTRGPYLTVYTPDACVKTMAAGAGWNLFCSFDRALPMKGDVALWVERIEAGTGAVEVAPDRVVLSFAGDIAQPAPEWLAGIREGDALTLRLDCAPGWENVESGLCLLFPLVKDGAVVPGLEQTAQPRSALGIRADGTLLLYAIDGRLPGHSVGAGLDAVARRLAELGCVYAGALDGGGSTLLSAVLPGMETLDQINRPSGGVQRSVVNYIFLATSARPTGSAARLALYPLDIDALRGAEVELTVLAVDENGYAVPAPEGVHFSVSGDFGTVEDGRFRALRAGSGVVTASAPGCESVEIPVTVVESPDGISLYGEVHGQLTSSLALDRGQEVDLSARAEWNHVSLSCDDGCFTWELDEEAGSVDETGHIVPSERGGIGELTVSAGETSVTVPITVRGLPFLDVPNDHIRYEAVRYVYENKIFAGTSETAFEPDTVMSRGMLVTVLWRMEGQPEAAGTPSFADVAPGDWFGPAVAWATERGIVAGYSAEAFGPMDQLTKEQILTILYRYAGSPDPDPAMWGAQPDAGEESPYAVPALAWAAAPELDLLLADDEGYIRPQSPMTRADVAETLMRYLEAQ